MLAGAVHGFGSIDGVVRGESRLVIGMGQGVNLLFSSSKGLGEEGNVAGGGCRCFFICPVTVSVDVLLADGFPVVWNWGVWILCVLVRRPHCRPRIEMVLRIGIGHTDESGRDLADN